MAKIPEQDLGMQRSHMTEGTERNVSVEGKLA